MLIDQMFKGLFHASINSRQCNFVVYICVKLAQIKNPCSDVSADPEPLFPSASLSPDVFGCDAADASPETSELIQGFVTGGKRGEQVHLFGTIYLNCSHMFS